MLCSLLTSAFTLLKEVKIARGSTTQKTGRTNEASPRPSPPLTVPDVVEVLGAIPPARVAHMQRTIRTFAHCLHYFDAESPISPPGSLLATGAGVVGDRPDAFDIILRAAGKKAAQSLERLPLEQEDCRPAPEG